MSPPRSRSAPCPSRTCGGAAYFQRAEVRDLLAWLRALADPTDAGAVVRALSRPPVDLRSVDIALITQLSRRRKLDMARRSRPRSRARSCPRRAATACSLPAPVPRGRAGVRGRRADAFVHRLIERIGLRRQQLFAAQADTVERLRIAKLGDLATAYMRREPHATPRDFARYIAAVAESGLPEAEATGTPTAPAVQVMTMDAPRGLECDHVFVLGLSAAAMPGPDRRRRRRAGRAARSGAARADGREAHETGCGGCSTWR